MAILGRPPKTRHTDDPVVLAARRSIGAETLVDHAKTVLDQVGELVNPAALTVPQLLRLLADRLEDNQWARVPNLTPLTGSTTAER